MTEKVKEKEEKKGYVRAEGRGYNSLVRENVFRNLLNFLKDLKKRNGGGGNQIGSGGATFWGRRQKEGMLRPGGKQENYKRTSPSSGEVVSSGLGLLNTASSNTLGGCEGR